MELKELVDWKMEGSYLTQKEKVKYCVVSLCQFVFCL